MRALGIGEFDDGVGLIGAMYAFGRYRYASCVSVDYIYKPVTRRGEGSNPTLAEVMLATVGLKGEEQEV